MKTMLQSFKSIYIVLAFLLFGTVEYSFAQVTKNPFELTPRVQAPSEKEPATSEQSSETTNPFELTQTNNDSLLTTNSDAPVVAPTITNQKTSPAATDNPFEIISSPNNPSDVAEIRAVDQPTTPALEITTPTLTSPKVNPRLLNGVIFFTLVLLAVLASLFRSALTKSIQAFFNDNLLGQIYREQSFGLTIPYLSLYILFLLNAGIFTFLILKYFRINVLPEQFSGILGTILVVGGLLLLKLLVLWLIGKIYPIEKETKLYSFTVTIFSIVSGLLLIPANILLAYASEEVVYYTIYGVAIGLGLIYLLRTLRGVLIANRFLLFHKFHFLLYICTIEIAPVIVLLKFI